MLGRLVRSCITKDFLVVISTARIHSKVIFFITLGCISSSSGEFPTGFDEIEAV